MLPSTCNNVTCIELSVLQHLEKKYPLKALETPCQCQGEADLWRKGRSWHTVCSPNGFSWGTFPKCSEGKKSQREQPTPASTGWDSGHKASWDLRSQLLNYPTVCIQASLKSLVSFFAVHVQGKQQNSRQELKYWACIIAAGGTEELRSELKAKRTFHRQAPKLGKGTPWHYWGLHVDNKTEIGQAWRHLKGPDRPHTKQREALLLRISYRTSTVYHLYLQIIANFKT